MKYIIDRIEDGRAVLECLETDESVDIDAMELPKEAKEGDVVCAVDCSDGNAEGETYIIDHASTEERRARLTKRMNDLFARKRG